MKSNTILTYILAASLVLGVWFFWRQLQHERELGNLAPQIAPANQYHAAVQSLIMECMEYGKKNPDINRILQPILNAPTNAPSAATAPAAAKPATR